MEINKQEWFPSWVKNIRDLTIPDHWKDSTWHNDATCSFTNNGKQVWIDAKDSKDSGDHFDQDPDSYFRFIIQNEKDFGMYDKPMMLTNDWEKVKEVMNNKQPIGG
tara:strand:+ start:431 stop:748 length:318 start_codon:yes stop_codon:yes gene_type:complete